MAKLTTPLAEAGQDQAPVVIIVDDALVEQIWQEVYGKATRMLIHQLVVEVTSEFAGATITTFVPIFVRRQVHKKLASMLDDAEGGDARRTINSASGEMADSEEDFRPTTGRFGKGQVIWLFDALP